MKPGYVRQDGDNPDLAFSHLDTEARVHVERFTAALELSADAIFFVDPEEMRILDVNAAACKVMGYERQEMLALPPTRGLHRESDQASVTVLYDEVIARSPEVLKRETEFVRRDGSVFPAEVHLLAIRSAGRWVIVITMRDLTEHKAAQAEHIEAKRKLELFRSAMDHGPDGLFLVDRATMRVLDLNVVAQRDTGLKVGQLVPPRWSVSGTRDALERSYDGAIAMAPDVQVDFREVRLADRTFPAEVRRRAVQIDGRWVIVVSARDMTELQQRMDELARSNQELDSFAYVVSHDLSEPLRMISSYAKLLERRYKDRLDGDALEFMEYIIGGARRMGQLLHDLLEYSRAGRDFSRVQPVDLNLVLEDVLANLRYSISEKGATVEAGHLPSVSADRTSMLQLLQNLVGNALKFQRPGTTPRVRISAVEEGDRWTVSVADNGIGIAPEHFERIFVIFQRLHSREAYTGTGIGLAICKKLVERHGGRIGVHSETDVGTTFWFTMPKDASCPSVLPR
jgi:PAS domain S-box-containing protein